MTRRFAFVTPRFGQGLVGGAEALCGSLARLIRKQGDSVEILTTTAKDNRTWEHFFPEGLAVEQGLSIRRFRVKSRNLEAWVPLQIKLSEGLPLSFSEELIWVEEGVLSLELIEYLASNSGRYDAIFFAPFWVGTTLYGAMVAPERSIIIPCLHDEPAAYLQVTRSVFQGVGRAIFNCMPEANLVARLFPGTRGGEVGMVVEETAPGHNMLGADPVQLPFDGSRPFILYLGRKETGKGAHTLIDYFIYLKESCAELESLCLVIAGGGSFSDLHRPSALAREDIIDLPAVSEGVKQDLLRRTLALVQPSVMESFSIVLMEAWLQGAPALVHGLCAVTRHHVIAASGGLYFSSPDDFCGVVRELAGAPELRAKLGANGRDYVRERYSSATVSSRLYAVVDELLGAHQVLPTEALR